MPGLGGWVMLEAARDPQKCRYGAWAAITGLAQVGAGHLAPCTRQVIELALQLRNARRCEPRGPRTHFSEAQSNHGGPKRSCEHQGRQVRVIDCAPMLHDGCSSGAGSRSETTIEKLGGKREPHHFAYAFVLLHRGATRPRASPLPSLDAPSLCPKPAMPSAADAPSTSGRADQGLPARRAAPPAQPESMQASARWVPRAHPITEIGLTAGIAGVAATIFVGAYGQFTVSRWQGQGRVIGAACGGARAAKRGRPRAAWASIRHPWPPVAWMRHGPPWCSLLKEPPPLQQPRNCNTCPATRLPLSMWVPGQQAARLAHAVDPTHPARFAAIPCMGGAARDAPPLLRLLVLVLLRLQRLLHPCPPPPAPNRLPNRLLQACR